MFNSMAIVSGLLLFALFANGTFACFPSSDKEPPEIEVKLPEPTVNVTVCEPQAYDIIFGLDNDVRKDHYEAIGEQIYKFIEPLKLGNGPNETRVAGLVAGVSDRVSLGSFSTAPEFIRAFRGVALKPNTGQSDITDVMQKAAGEFTKKSKERKAKNVKRVMILFYGNNGPVRPVSSSATYALAGDMAKKASVFTYVFPYGGCLYHSVNHA
ncbi:hypothetical protein QR680_004454 [Steinernema hermaphroditum]|uniref:VWFA domain-containing protein n=1 Tax=Steinernema hermaphroditum TaxID=289476 RepID=A0AA39HR17_9BILA|nr:hypothetical protein QR680_004454 [Steinernema hermaphroditum]